MLMKGIAPVSVSGPYLSTTGILLSLYKDRVLSPRAFREQENKSSLLSLSVIIAWHGLFIPGNKGTC